jgi:hypothetical protein
MHVIDTSSDKHTEYVVSGILGRPHIVIIAIKMLKVKVQSANIHRICLFWLTIAPGIWAPSGTIQIPGALAIYVRTHKALGGLLKVVS